MKSITIKGSERESVGKSATRALRDAGRVPCVLYGGSENVVHFSANEVDFNPLVYTSDVHSVKLEFENKTVNAVLQDIQFHPVTDDILHMDFYQFDADVPISMTIPVHTVGQPSGVKAGGVLLINMRRMDLEGLIDDLPDYIEVDISDLEIGDNLYVTAAKSDKYEILHDEDEVICMVNAPRDLEALEEDIEPEDVEVPATEQEDEEAEEGEEEEETEEDEEK
ncbi:MAG TPA: 50S ribosomal protein L25/general stress protein Ctc [Flavobacteriaceae bacterium]|nr:50S ribosomal protein L25/general stress protein Ctc [Flavobacteriaceae bacterium]